MAITNSEVNGTVDVPTVPAGKSYAVTSILITNVGPSFQMAVKTVITLYAVTGSYSQQINDSEQRITGAETFTLDTEKIVLGAGDFIRVVNQVITIFSCG